MSRLIYYTGGARSGKSAQAEARAMGYASALYLATAEPFDEEMRARIAMHRARRPAHWETREGIDGLGAALAATAHPVAVLDCLTLLVTNWMMRAPCDWDHPSQADIQEAERLARAAVEELLRAVPDSRADLIVVSNEVGMGLVPVYPFGRAFRDVAGRANQKVAQAADEAYLMVSGLALRLK